MNIIEADGFNVCNNCGDTHDRIYAQSTVYKRQKGGSLYNKIIRDKEIVVKGFGPRTIIALNEAIQYNYRKLRNINNHDYGKHATSYKESYPLFNTVCHLLSTPKYIKEYAWRIFSKLVKSGLKTHIESRVGGCIYYSYKVHNIYIDYKELCDYLDISFDRVLRVIEKVDNLSIHK